MKDPGYEKIYTLYNKGVNFNQQIELYQNVENNENFYVGKQWEGVQSNGNPTPVFNLIRRVASFQVSKITADNFTIQTKPLNAIATYTEKQARDPMMGMGQQGNGPMMGMEQFTVEQICDVVNRQFMGLIERNKLVSLNREFVRNAAVDRDACLYSWFDPDMETGQEAKGDIRTEIVENTRVYFGNQNDKNVETQPYIILQMRWQLDRVKDLAKDNGVDEDQIKTDQELQGNYYDNLTDDKVTVLTYFARDRKTGTIWSGKYTRNCVLEKLKDTGMKRYPIVWMPWDYVQNCYHGYSLVEQVIPNQVYINQLFAMTMRSLMSTAFPKVIYDKSRIRNWDGGVGRAIAVNGGGDLNNIARVMDPAAISPQVSQFIQMAIDYTQSLMGASDSALGDGRADNTSAIIALQRASDAPLELVKNNVYQALEDLAYIYLDMMRVYYGKRNVQVKMMSNNQLNNQPLQMTMPQQDFILPFDFSVLNDVVLNLTVDVGASSYWSEIATTQTLDNLLMQQVITLDEYLERLPDGFVSMKQELIDKRRGMNGHPNNGANTPIAGMQQQVPVEGGGGYGQLQRALNTTGVV